MTTGKPPQPLHKTLLGMPSDLQEVLDKLRAENPAPRNPAELQAAQSPESIQASSDLASTRYGNAYGNASAAPERSPWPNLPQSRAFEPPTLPVGVHGAPPPVSAAQQLPSDRSQPQVSRERPIWPPPAEANPWAENPGVEPLPVAPRRPPSAASAVATRIGLANESVPTSQPAARARTATPPPLRPRSSLEGTGPDRERSQLRPPFAHRTPTAVPFDGGVTVAEFRDEPARDPVPMHHASQFTLPKPIHPQTFASFEPPAAPSACAAGSALAGETAWVARPVATRAPVVVPKAEPPIRRWPALALIGAAAIGLGVLLVMRAPALLPRLGARSSTSLNAATESAANPSPPSAASAAPRIDPRELAAEQRLELEQQATDLLSANNYAGARAVYQRLAIADPTRADYTRMLTFLAHKLDAACGGLGQAACAPAR